MSDTPPIQKAPSPGALTTLVPSGQPARGKPEFSRVLVGRDLQTPSNA